MPESHIKKVECLLGLNSIYCWNEMNQVYSKKHSTWTIMEQSHFQLQISVLDHVEKLLIVIILEQITVI